jgi:hypothetical protein
MEIRSSRFLRWQGAPALRALPERPLSTTHRARRACSRERSDQLGWHAERTPAIQVDVHPLGPGSHQRLSSRNVGRREQAVGGDCDGADVGRGLAVAVHLIGAHRPRASYLLSPRDDLEHVTGRGGTKVLDLVAADDEKRAQLPVARAGNRRRRSARWPPAPGSVGTPHCSRARPHPPPSASRRCVRHVQMPLPSRLRQ